MKIYTKKGDNGNSSTISESNIPKNSKIFECLGSLDELNASIGITKSICNFDEINELLIKIQSDLLILGSQVSSKNSKIAITEESITFLESSIDKIESELVPLNNFILPGGSEVASRLNFSRTICRRAERRIVDILDSIAPVILKYINRLSDLLFVLSRYANKLESVEEIVWKGK